MSFRNGTGVQSISRPDAFAARVERNRERAREYFRSAQREVEILRRLRENPDAVACLVCGSRSLLVRPIYGNQLPGCCPLHWDDARAAVEAFVGGWLQEIMSRVKLVPGGTGVLVQSIK